MNRDFKGIWIPREIWLNKNLSIQAKALWSEIWSLHDRESGGCYASNEYLCEFLDIKLSRLKEIMKELRDNGYIIDISFDGRQRIIRANLPEPDYGGQQPAGKPTPPQPENRPAPSLDSGQPSLLDKRRDKTIRDKTSLKVPEEPVAAKAADDKVNISIDVAKKIVGIIQAHEPEYRPPKTLAPLVTEVDLLLRVDKRDPEKICDVLNWALGDDFWRPKMFKPNPVKYLREKFLQLKNQMEAKPQEKKVDRRTRNMDGTPVDAPHLDNLF